MKIKVDDWHFMPAQANHMTVDLFLENGQRGLLDVRPLEYLANGQPAGSEMIVWCEMPGETLADQAAGKARWITRPPDATCPWSRVEIPNCLQAQIAEHLQQVSGPGATA